MKISQIETNGRAVNERAEQLRLQNEQLELENRWVYAIKSLFAYNLLKVFIICFNCRFRINLNFKLANFSFIILLKTPPRNLRKKCSDQGSLIKRLEATPNIPSSLTTVTSKSKSVTVRQMICFILFRFSLSCLYFCTL